MPFNAPLLTSAVCLPLLALFLSFDAYLKVYNSARKKENMIRLTQILDNVNRQSSRAQCCARSTCLSTIVNAGESLKNKGTVKCVEEHHTPQQWGVRSLGTETDV